MHDHAVLKKIKKKGRKKETQFINEVIKDLWICLISREVSILGRKEVLSGKGKFGILGDGKELPQVVMAKYFKKGDYRSGYYRDQTFMFALGLCTVEQFFAQLYADSENDPFSKGRQMNSHFATKFIDENDDFVNLTTGYNVTSDISCTAGQVGRALGIGLASKKFRNIPALNKLKSLSNNGDEVSFCTIGDASTSEGAFWETMNAAAVTQVPLVMNVWDDGFGISVPIELQTVKGSISSALEGFWDSEDGKGIRIYTVKGYDYRDLCTTYERAVERTRKTHQPCLIHVKDLTQPLGHSTSGSHERYKGQERLQFEKDFDCIERMIDWVVNERALLTLEEVDQMRSEAKTFVKESAKKAWSAYNTQALPYKERLDSILKSIVAADGAQELIALKKVFDAHDRVQIHEVQIYARRLMLLIGNQNLPSRIDLNTLINEIEALGNQRYHTDLYSDSPKSALKVPVVPPEYSDKSETLNAYQIINQFFDNKLSELDELIAFGEDVGKIGDVNQGFAGLQEKYGDQRVYDAGIREWTIIGQGIGLAMRGLRPIAEIQYLDYINYAYSPIADDLATLRYRSGNLQCAPLIIRSRGHRLEGIWHAGSPIGSLMHAFRGIYICVPRNLVQAAGMYNTLLQSSDPALVIECLNAYRLKEQVPDNIGTYTVALGTPEILQEGTDLTLVSYGSCIRIIEEALQLIEPLGVSVEFIDIQTILPFDLNHVIGQSLSKTSKLILVDEDVPGGATGFMLQQIIEEQKGYFMLDAPPVTLTAKAHRPPYGSDGDYFSKPNAEDVAEAIIKLHQV